MEVHVEDGNALCAAGHEHVGDDGSVVQKAIAAELVARGVVARWTAKGKGSPRPARNRPLRGLGAGHGRQRCGPGSPSDRGFRGVAVVSHAPVDRARDTVHPLVPGRHRGGDDLAAIALGLPVGIGGLKERQETCIQKPRDGPHVYRAGVGHGGKGPGP